MRRRWMAWAVLLATVCCAPGTEGETRRDMARLERGVDQLFADWRKPGSPGGAVVLTDGGKVVLQRCYGLADLEQGVSITPTTRFELASVSKPFTAFAVLLLEEAGRLSLQDDIRLHLPELPDYGAPITVADLLHHTSGLSDWPKVRAYAGQEERSGFGMQDLLSLVARQRTLEFEPGAKYSYSNTNYALLAEIVARVTGRPFGGWMEENVFRPLKMRDTSVPSDWTRVLPHRANSYYLRSNREFVRGPTEGFEIPGSAHVFSTIEDMAKWMDNLRTGKVGGRDLIERMQERPTLRTGEQSSYGAGLGMGEYRGVRTAGHSGQTGAFKTELLCCPDIGVGVVVLGNVGSMRADEVSRGVLDLYLGDRLAPLPAAAKGAADAAPAPFLDLDPAEAERLVGGYRLEADPSVLLALAVEEGWLVGVMVGEGLDFFRPIGPYEYENRHRTCRLTFSREEGREGPGARVRVTLRGNEMWATRVPLSRDARWIDECVGFYYSDELGAAYAIVRSAGGLAVRIPGSDVRPLSPADTDILAGGIGVLTFRRGESGRVTGFDFGEPEDLGGRLIRFDRREGCR